MLRMLNQSNYSTFDKLEISFRSDPGASVERGVVAGLGSFLPKSQPVLNLINHFVERLSWIQIHQDVPITVHDELTEVPRYVPNFASTRVLETLGVIPQEFEGFMRVLAIDIALVEEREVGSHLVDSIALNLFRCVQLLVQELTAGEGYDLEAVYLIFVVHIH